MGGGVTPHLKSQVKRTATDADHRVGLRILDATAHDAAELSGAAGTTGIQQNVANDGVVLILHAVPSESGR
jgi:uncharacterized protein (DUF1684 family)